MNRSTVFVILLIAMFASLLPIAEAQVRGIPPSVTSLAPGRQFLPGPSVTSLGPRGWDHGPVLLGNRHFFGPGTFFNQGGFVNRGGFGRDLGFVPVFVPIYTPYGTGIYPMMYADPDSGMDPSAPGTSSLYMPDPNFAGAYSPRTPSQSHNQVVPSDSPEQDSATASSQPASSPDPQPATMLVFKDGRKLEVTNYVIQGSTLFNLGDKGPRKIALADLDLNETARVNDDRGVTFTLPQ